jgi:hypothetical protein
LGKQEDKKTVESEEDKKSTIELKRSGTLSAVESIGKEKLYKTEGKKKSCVPIQGTLKGCLSSGSFTFNHWGQYTIRRMRVSIFVPEEG